MLSEIDTHAFGWLYEFISCGIYSLDANAPIHVERLKRNSFSLYSEIKWSTSVSNKYQYTTFIALAYKISGTLLAVKFHWNNSSSSFYIELPEQ